MATVKAYFADGSSLPLDQVAWTMRDRCGCVLAAVIAHVDAIDGWTLSSEEQAHQHFVESAVERLEQSRNGVRFDLVPVGGIGLWQCDRHNPDNRERN